MLVAGETYTITEATAPNGYELAGSVQFTVGADGAIAIASGVTAGSGTYVASAEDGTAVITATDELTELTVLKATADPNASDGKTYLAGAEFTLTEVMNRGTEAGETADGSAREPQVLTGTTAEDGSVSFSGLKVNTSYVLEETEAPAGYERLADTATLVVAPDGTATIADGNASGAFAVASDGVTIEVMDHKLGVSLVKTDLAGTALAGGTFKLAPADEGATFLDGTAEKEFTSDEFGAVFTDLQLEGSAEGTAYVLTETEAPAGFERIDPVDLPRAMRTVRWRSPTRRPMLRANRWRLSTTPRRHRRHHRERHADRALTQEDRPGWQDARRCRVQDQRTLC